MTSTLNIFVLSAEDFPLFCPSCFKHGHLCFHRHMAAMPELEECEAPTFAHGWGMAPLPVGLALGLCWPLHKIPNIAGECYHIIKVESIPTCPSINWTTRVTTADS